MHYILAYGILLYNTYEIAVIIHRIKGQKANLKLNPNNIFPFLCNTIRLDQTMIFGLQGSTQYSHLPGDDFVSFFFFIVSTDNRLFRTLKTQSKTFGQALIKIEAFCVISKIDEFT